MIPDDLDAKNNEVAKAMLIVEMKNSTLYGTNRISITCEYGVPQLLIMRRRLGGHEIRVDLSDVNGIYCAVAGTLDEQARAEQRWREAAEVTER